MDCDGYLCQCPEGYETSVVREEVALDTVDGETVTAITTTYICSDINECAAEPLRNSCPSNSGTTSSHSRVLCGVKFVRTYLDHHSPVRVLPATRTRLVVIQPCPFASIVMSALVLSVTLLPVARILRVVSFAIALLDSVVME